MGILNVTPDSFFDGGNYCGEHQQLERAENMLSEGADIIDIGGYSTRPGMAAVSQEEELQRLIPAIKTIKRHFPHTSISIDTFNSGVAKHCIDEGADIINDISGGQFDPNMLRTVAENHIPYVLMHTTGNVSTLHKDEIITSDACNKVRSFFERQYDTLKSLGSTDIALDPGIGFGKSLESNYDLLTGIDRIRIHDCPVLIGISRKSLIFKPLAITPQETLNGTTVLNTIALLHGADILRVHDVKEAAEAIKLFGLAKRK